MKKWIALLFAGILITGIVGCGPKADDTGANTGAVPADTSKDRKTEEPKTTEPTPGPAAPAAPAPGGEAPKTGEAAPPAGNAAPPAAGGK